jgi:hypothetical protein
MENGIEYLESIPGYEGLKIPRWIEHFDVSSLDWVTDIFLLGMEELAENDEYVDLFDWLGSKIFPYVEEESHVLEIAWGFGVLSSVDASKMYYQMLDGELSDGE